MHRTIPSIRIFVALTVLLPSVAVAGDAHRADSSRPTQEVRRSVRKKIADLERRVSRLEGSRADAKASEPMIRSRNRKYGVRKLERRVRRLEARVSRLRGRDSPPTHKARKGDRRERFRLLRRRLRRLEQNVVRLESSVTAPPPHVSGWEDAGPTPIACPAGSDVVTSEDDPNAALSKAGTNASVCFKKGTYRLQEEIRPLDGQDLIFKPGAVLTGARLVTNWNTEGDLWVSSGHRQELSDVAWLVDAFRCEDNPAACVYEDVYFDDRPLEQVLSQTELGPGKVYFDRVADKLYLSDSPAGRRIEAVVTGMGVSSGADDVSIRGATLERFAWYGIQTSGDRWTIEHNEIRYVHATCLATTGGDGHVIRSNHIHHGGNGGLVMGGGEGALVEGNNLHDHNYLHFGAKPIPHHEGATKFLLMSDTVVRNNYSHHNDGDGWWFDWDNVDVVVKDNLFSNNTRYGLFYEASFAAVIESNVFRGNGTDSSWYGSGLRISTSKDVEVFSNLFVDNAHTTIHIVWEERGVSSGFGPRQTSGLFIHDNTLKMSEGYVGVPYGREFMLDAAYNNRIDRNHYVVPGESGLWWRLHESWIDWPRWQALGFDVNGSLTLSPG